MRFTDIHCHILPGVDDGAKNIRMMKEMLSIAYADGIRRIICTSHYHIGRMTTDPEQIFAALDTVKKMAKKYFPELSVYSGQEIYDYSDALEKLERGELLTLAETDYVLLEYSTSAQYEMIRDSVFQMYNAGFLPVIAHAERYGCLFGDVKKMEELVRTGAYVQINADSLEGSFTNPVRKFAGKLLKEGLVHFIASDAHSTSSRKPELSKAYHFVEKKIGSEAAERIFLENPQLLLENKEL